MDDDGGTEPRIDASKVRLRDVLKPRKTVIDYIYDFGDCWEHRLTVTNVRAAEPGMSYPRYIVRGRSGAREGSCGIPGRAGRLEALAAPNHTNHAATHAQHDEYD